MSHENIYSLLEALGASPPRDEPTRDFISSLPVEIAVPILRLLDGASLLHCATVCQRWLDVIRGDSFLRARVREHLIWLRMERFWDVVGPMDVQRGDAAEGCTARQFAPRNGKYRVVRKRYSGSGATGFPYDVSKRRSGRFGGQGQAGIQITSSSSALAPLLPILTAVPVAVLPPLPTAAQTGAGHPSSADYPSAAGNPAPAPAREANLSSSRRRSGRVGVSATRRSGVGTDNPGPPTSTGRRRSGVGVPTATARRSGVVGTPSQRAARAARSARIKAAAAARARLRRL